MKRKTHNKKAFTILEVVIVIIIIGILAALAMPKLFQAADFSRSDEALNMFKEIKSGMHRCSMMRNGDFSACTGFNVIGMADPGLEPGANFSYSFTTVNATDYVITATGTFPGANPSNDRIQLRFDGSSGNLESCVDGDDAGVFAPVQQGDCPGGGLI